MQAKRVIVFVVLLLVGVNIYSTSIGRESEDYSSINTYIMVNRYGYSSNPHSIAYITDSILKDYPILDDAFQIEYRANAIGLAHPVEWVVCSYEEGKALEQMINGLPSTGEGSLRLEYLGVKYMFSFHYEKNPPVIS